MLARIIAAFDVACRVLGFKRAQLDWSKVAKYVAANPDDAYSKRMVARAERTNNVEFFQELYLAQGDLEETSSHKVRQALSEQYDGRAFLPGSPSTWGWAVDQVAERAVIVQGLRDALHSSLFDINDDLEAHSSPAALNGIELRDRYLEAYELHHEPLIWTICPSRNLEWILTPSSLLSRNCWKMLPGCCTVPRQRLDLSSSPLMKATPDWILSPEEEANAELTQDYERNSSEQLYQNRALIPRVASAEPLVKNSESLILTLPSRVRKNRAAAIANSKELVLFRSQIPRLKPRLNHGGGSSSTLSTLSSLVTTSAATESMSSSLVTPSSARRPATPQQRPHSPRRPFTPTSPNSPNGSFHATLTKSNPPYQHHVENRPRQHRH